MTPWPDYNRSTLDKFREGVFVTVLITILVVSSGLFALAIAFRAVIHFGDRVLRALAQRGTASDTDPPNWQ